MFPDGDANSLTNSEPHVDRHAVTHAASWDDPAANSYAD
jgi:hypothetical protein